MARMIGPRKPKNILSSLLENFAHTYEFPVYKEGDRRVKIGIEVDGKIIYCQYIFDPSDDGYEFVAALANIDDSDIDEISRKIATSKPVRGIVERIIGGKFLIFGCRDNLRSLSKLEIQRGYMDDIFRISEYFGELGELID